MLTLIASSPRGRVDVDAFALCRFEEHNAALTLTAAVLPVGAAGLVPAVALSPPRGVPSAAVLGALFGLVIASTAVAFWLFYRLVQRVGASRASVVTYLAPLVAVVGGFWILGEEVTTATVVGLALILDGSAVAGKRDT